MTRSKKQLSEQGLTEVCTRHLNYLVTRDAHLRTLEEQSYKDSLTEVQASMAFTELMFKVLKSKDEAVVAFWKERLLKLEHLIGINARLKGDMEVLEYQYKVLYQKYDEQIDQNIKLMKDF